MQPEFSEAFKANPFFFVVSTGIAVAAGVVALGALLLVIKKPKIAIVVGALAVLGSLMPSKSARAGRAISGIISKTNVSKAKPIRIVSELQWKSCCDDCTTDWHADLDRSGCNGDGLARGDGVCAAEGVLVGCVR